MARATKQTDSIDGPPMTAILVGAGVRGKVSGALKWVFLEILINLTCSTQTYAQFAVEHPERMKLVGVAEPRDHHRAIVQKR